MMNQLVLFDFDGTITSRDSFPLFFRFTFGRLKFFTGFLIFVPLFILYKFQLLDGGIFKKHLLSFYLKNKKTNWLKEKGELYCNFLEKTGIIKPKFVSLINNYKENNATIVVVSASPDIWVKPFAEKHGIYYICTELLHENNLFTGNLKTKNCNGSEKKKRILQKFDITEFNEIVAYGDSSGDDFMMELANVKNWVK